MRCTHNGNISFKILDKTGNKSRVNLAELQKSAQVENSVDRTTTRHAIQHSGLNETVARKKVFLKESNKKHALKYAQNFVA